jgi:AcrR family transcriptional regulator
VTVFYHFSGKEDRFMDRAADAVGLLRSTVRDRASDVGALTSLRDKRFRLLDPRHLRRSAYLVTRL